MVWMLRDDHRKVDETAVFAYLDQNRKSLFTAGNGVGKFELEAVEIGGLAWRDVAAKIGGTTMIIGVTGNQLMNQILMPRGGTIVILDCTGCVYGRKASAPQRTTIGCRR